jgi:hypothetical protein
MFDSHLTALYPVVKKKVHRFILLFYFFTLFNIYHLSNMSYKNVKQSGESSARASTSSSDDFTLPELSTPQPTKLSHLRLILLTCPNFG